MIFVMVYLLGCIHVNDINEAHYEVKTCHLLQEETNLLYSTKTLALYFGSKSIKLHQQKYFILPKWQGKWSYVLVLAYTVAMEMQETLETMYNDTL